MARGLYIPNLEPAPDIVSRSAFTTFTSFADIYGGPQKFLPLKRMEPGLIIECFAAGVYGTTGTPTLSGGFYINGNPSTAPTTLVAPTTILGQSQLAAPGGTTMVNGAWNSYLRAILRSIGPGAAGGSWRIMAGFFKVASSLSPFNTLVEWNLPVTEALRTVTFDCTADRAIGPGWQWGTSSSSNTVTVDEFELRLIS